MKIEIGRYTLVSDSCCYYITKRYTGKDKNGKEKTQEKRVSGYHKNLTDTLKSFVDRAPRDSEAKEVREVLEVFAETEKTLKQFIDSEYAARDTQSHTERRKYKG